ncbi:MAG: glucosaminidase domain-containing protein [Acidimicrobiia bacterium]
MFPRIVVFVALFVGMGLVAAPIPPAHAQVDPFDAEIEQARQQVQEAQSAAHASAAELAATQARQVELTAQVAQVQASIAELLVRIPALEAETRQLRRTVRERAAAVYSSGGPAAIYGPISFDPNLAQARRRVLADAAAKRDADTIAQLKATTAELRATQEQLTAQQVALAQQQADLAALETRLQSQQTELAERVAIANAALERATAIGALRARGEPVLGPTILTGAQMAAWIKAKGYKTRIETSIEDLANTFVEEGQAEGVRGDLAFAQAVVETAGFNASPSNNYAGMGWCDSCSNGRRFPTPRDGIRAQIQHLKNYADPTSRASGLANPPSPYWYGSDPATAARNFDTFFAKGWAPTWVDMGNGNWATAKHYSAAVLNVYADLVAFARTGTV